MSEIRLDQLKEGTAIVDLRHKEIFSYAKACDEGVMEQYPDSFRLATKQEAKKLSDSGQTSTPLE